MPDLARLAAPAALLLIAAGAFCGGQEGREAAPPSPPPSMAPVFSSLRHPSVADAAGPYPVAVVQLAGPSPLAGELRYSVGREGQAAGAEIGVGLVRGEREWRAGIPGQPAGTEIRYHFVFRLAGGATVAHPRQAPEARYRFRVLPVRWLGLSIPLRPPPGPVPVSATVEAASPPGGVVRFRTSRGGFENVVPLTSEPAAGGRFRLHALLPARPVGTIVDLYFEMSAGGSGPVRFPADAPARFFSFKIAGREVRAMTGGPRVASVAAVRKTLWIGLDGGGLLELDGGRASRRTVAEGLPSSRVRALAPDSAEGIVYVGTDNGAVLARPGQASLEPVAGPVFQQPGDSPFGRLREARQADLAAVSPLDGSVVLRLLPAERELEGEPPASLLLELLDGRLGRLSPGGLAQVATVWFDEADGCLLLAGGTAAPPGEVRPALLRRCGGSLRPIPIPPLPVAGASLRAIEALGRDPATGALALAAGYAVERQGRPAVRHGIFTLSGNGLSALAVDLPAPVTSLLADWPRRRLLAGTGGAGLLVLENGKSSVLRSLECGEVTSLAPGPETGEVLAGTACGLYRLAGETALPVEGELFQTGAVRPDLSPVDVDSGGRALLLSATGGLVILSSGRTSMLAAGREIPQGTFLDAAFGAGGDRIFAVLRSRGLLRVGPELQVKLLTAAEGLYRTDVMKVFRHDASGLLWLLFPERPSGGGGIQLYDGAGGGRFLPLRDPPPSSIRDLLLVPERDSVFAATGTGVLALRADGSAERLSETAAAALARDPRTGGVIAAGSALQRWDGRAFRPVVSMLDHPRFPAGRLHLRPPLDVAVDGRGHWHVLHPDGHLVEYDGAGRTLQVLDFEDGIPVTARAVVCETKSGLLIVGSAAEGAVLLRPR